MQTEQKGRALYVVLALVFAGLIVGGAAWFYFSKDRTESDATTTNQTNNAVTTETDAAVAAKTELDGSLDELDSELAAIEVDEEADDDTVDF